MLLIFVFFFESPYSKPYSRSTLDTKPRSPLDIVAYQEYMNFTVILHETKQILKNSSKNVLPYIT